MVGVVVTLVAGYRAGPCGRGTMTLDVLMKWIGELGVPIVFAAVLLWFFLNTVKKLSDQNDRLLKELSSLREHFQSTVHAHELNERLMQQNERLVESVRTKEEAFISLLQQVSRDSGLLAQGDTVREGVEVKHGK